MYICLIVMKSPEKTYQSLCGASMKATLPLLNSTKSILWLAFLNESLIQMRRFIPEGCDHDHYHFFSLQSVQNSRTFAIVRHVVQLDITSNQINTNYSIQFEKDTKGAEIVQYLGVSGNFIESS